MPFDVTQTVLCHHGIPSLQCYTIGCYTDMCCITMVFPHSLQCHAVGCYPDMNHHGVPVFFTVSCHWMLHRHVSPWCSLTLYSVMLLDVTHMNHHGVPFFFTVSCHWMLHSVVSPGYSLFLYSVTLLDVTQCCITMVFPLSFHCHAVGCYTDMCCITMVFPLSLQCHAVGCYTYSVVSP